MKKIFLVLIINISVCKISYAQDDLIKWEKTISNPIDDFHPKNKQEISAELSKICNNDTITDVQGKSIEELTGLDIFEDKGKKKDSLTNKVVIVYVEKMLVEDNGAYSRDESKINITILNKEYVGFKKVWSDYILGRKNIMLVFVDKTTRSKNFKVENQESFFAKSFYDMIKFVADYSAFSDNKIRFVLLKKQKIAPPSELSMSIPYDSVVFPKGIIPTTIKLKSTGDEVLNFERNIENGELDFRYELDTIVDSIYFKIRNLPVEDVKSYELFSSKKIKIHENNKLAFTVGVSGVQLDLQQFKFKNDTLSITLDSTQQQEWKAKLIVGLEYYPFGRDIDRFEPIWKQPFTKLHKRFGLYGGFQLSKDPLNALYAGVVMSLSKTISITGGCTWVNQVEPQVKYISGISNLDDAIKYADREYKRSFFLGISLAPSEMAKVLGLNKKEEK